MTVEGTLEEVDSDDYDIDDSWRRFQSERSDILVRETEDGIEFGELETLIDLSGISEDNPIPSSDEMMESALRAISEEKYGDSVPWELED